MEEYKIYKIDELHGTFKDDYKSQYGFEDSKAFTAWISNEDRIGEIIEFEIDLTDEFKEKIKNEGFNNILLRPSAHTYEDYHIDIEVYEVYLSK